MGPPTIQNWIYFGKFDYAFMAKFDTIPPFRGTIDSICIYRMHGRYYLRSRSSLTAERVKKDPSFQKTMQYAALLGKASRIGSIVYALVPADRKQHSFYRKLTGEAMTWLKYQWTEEDIIDYLVKQFIGQGLPLRESPSTALRQTYHPPKPGLVSTLNDLLETPAKKIPFRLHYWRCRDRINRRLYNQSLNTYSWSKNLIT
jgi:hypothetical protein